MKKKGSAVVPAPENSNQNESNRISDNRQKCIHMIDSKTFSLVMAIMTFYALFGDDIRVAAFKKRQIFQFCPLFFCKFIVTH